MQPITIYTTKWCPFCIRARQLLDSKGVSYQNISVDGHPELRQEMTEKAGQRTVPQIWIGEQHIGGCDDLYALERANKLDDLLQTQN